MEIRNCTDVEITGVTLKDSAFWTLHPVYCKDVHIHHMRIEAPSCRNYACANTDGIDVDSSENILIEHNYISVGDDHITVISGKLRGGRSPPTRNVTARDNYLGSGMGLSIGSSTAGGVSDVVYSNNIMRQEIKKNMGQGIHIKLRERFGGYVRNIAWIDNIFYVAGMPGGSIVFESGYQSGSDWKMKCNNETCTEVRDIVVRNLTIYQGNPGRINCFGPRPCKNITFENVRYLDTDHKGQRIKCDNVASGKVTDSFPPDLFDGESCVALYNDPKEHDIHSVVSSPEKVPSKSALDGASSLPRVIALYFPQFHPDPINDRLWGANFTDWDSLRNAPKLNRMGYAIPRPTELGYYDLSDETSDVRRKQGELAREHGIDAFAYHHYWFYDKKYPGPNLHRPLELMLRDGEPDVPFCLHWAAMKWVNTWQSSGGQTGDR